MTPSLINKAIQNIWKKAPINQKCITTTDVILADPTSRESLAAHMTHSPGTAGRHYNIINRRNNAIKVTNLIANVMAPMKITNIVELPNDTATNSTCESQIAHTAPTKAISNSIHWPVVTEMEKKETPMDKINEEDFERDEKDKEIDLEATTFHGEEDSQKDVEDYREVNDDILDSQKDD
ncbi:unnamed protein product [Mytilus edulis]|uniref:Uncharacterized protein n=1 Tax=Mytilus edulis TaxID=6550 RepID=A0A8S3TRZ5_MYTED|nr:unnamed protein product [Mytilus edulis]